MPAGLIDDESLLERILGHVDAGTTDLSERTWREPVAHYLSEERLSREIEQVLRRQPVPFCPSAALPDAGSYLAREVAGVPIIAVRDSDGIVRAFRNACRHRGTMLAAGAGCAAALVCPYHGWVYRLDGTLRHVPGAHGFPDLDASSRGLVPVDATEVGGALFVQQDHSPSGPSVDVVVPELIGPEQQLVDSSEFMVEANWKILLEGFLEGYHLKATHRNTFLPFGYDNLTVVEAFGRHSRVTFPFRRIEALRGLSPSEGQVAGAVTFVYHLFPNVIVARLSHHTTMVVLEPRAADQTNMVTYRLTNRPAATATAGSGRNDLARDTDFVTQGAIEDLNMALAVQRGLRSGANRTLEFGRFEGAIAHFHAQLTDLVDGAPVAAPPARPRAGMTQAVR